MVLGSRLIWALRAATTLSVSLPVTRTRAPQTASCARPGWPRGCCAIRPGDLLPSDRVLCPILGFRRALAEPRIKTEGCEVYATNQVDPIAGADHLHNQFGNTSTTDDSSGESLFANKETSCATDWFTSAAWFPVERGDPVSGISTYYRAPGNSQEVEDIPKGLQLLGEEVVYNCTSSGAGSFEESPPYGCRGDWTTRVVFPDCWNEDSLEETTMVSSNNGSCPPTHPYRIPEISFLIRHDNADGVVAEPLEVSGGVDSWGPYTEMHADYFAALQPAFEPLMDRCLREGRSCDDDASPGSQADGAGAASAAAETDGAQSDGAQSDGGGASEAPVGAASGEGGSASPGPGEDSGGVSSPPPDSSEDEGGFVGMAVDAAFAVLSALWDSSAADLAEQITEDLGEALFFMPDPTGAGALADIYDDAKKVMAPALLLGILIITLLKIVTSYNASGQSFSLAKLGHIVGVAVVLGTLPFVFGVLSTLSQDLTAALLPEGGDMMGAAANLLSPLTGLFSVTGPLTIIVALFALWVLAKVMIIALIKLITWPLLFIAANFVMPASLLPGCKHFAENYFKLLHALHHDSSHDGASGSTAIEEDGGEESDARSRRELADRVYRALLELCPLIERDRRFWHSRGVTDETIEEGGFGSLWRGRCHEILPQLEKRFGRDARVSVPGFYPGPHGGVRTNLYDDYTLIPYYGRYGYITTVEGRVPGKPEGKKPKYMAPVGAANHLYIFPHYTPERMVAFCEGLIGAVIAAQCGIPVAAIKGCYCYRTPGEKGEPDRPLPELEGVDFERRRCVYIPDLDVKPATREEVLALAPEAARRLIGEQNGTPLIAALPDGYKDLDEGLLALEESERLPRFAELLHDAITPEQWEGSEEEPEPHESEQAGYEEDGEHGPDTTTENETAPGSAEGGQKAAGKVRRSSATADDTPYQREENGSSSRASLGEGSQTHHEPGAGAEVPRVKTRTPQPRRYKPIPKTNIGEFMLSLICGLVTTVALLFLLVFAAPEWGPTSFVGVVPVSLTITVSLILGMAVVGLRATDSTKGAGLR